MPFAKILLLYLGTTIVFFAIDIIWLGLIAKGLYQKQIGHLMANEVNWMAAIIFYLLFIVGILVFCVFPALEVDSVVRAITLGAFFGGICYATYDLTNLATLKDWPIKIVVIDIVWGMVLTGIVATVSYYLAKWLMG